MTTATMLVYYYGFDEHELTMQCGGSCVNNGSMFEDGFVFIFKDGSALKIEGGVVWTAGRKRIWRRHALD